MSHPFDEPLHCDSDTKPDLYDPSWPISAAKWLIDARYRLASGPAPRALRDRARQILETLEIEGDRPPRIVQTAGSVDLHWQAGWERVTLYLTEEHAVVFHQFRDGRCSTNLQQIEPAHRVTSELRALVPSLFAAGKGGKS